MRAVALSLLVVLAACPRPFNPSGGGHFQLPDRGAKEARVKFDDARARFEHDEFDEAAREFEEIRRQYPDDPIAPFAALYAGMSAYKKGDAAGAVPLLKPVAEDKSVPDEVRDRARFYLGLADEQTGSFAEARALLEPFAGKLEKGTEDEGLLYAALAESAAALNEPTAALHYYDEFFTRARPAERAYVASRVAAIVDQLQPDVAVVIYERSDKKLATAAFLGRRLAASARAQGQMDRARSILDETRDARGAVGLPEEAGPAQGAGDPQIVGAVLPLSGKRHLLGEAVQRGLALAAGTFDRVPAGGLDKDGAPRPFDVSVEDSGEGKGRAGSSVDTLAAANVIGIVGPVDRDAAEEAARRAETLAVPLITLDVSDAPPLAGSLHVFRAVISPEERARALADYAHDHGATKFALLVPQIAYGTRAAAAFKKEVESFGGSIVAEQGYAKDATSFVDPVGKLGSSFDALFVPDTAARLELIAPQLAVADLIVQSREAKKPRRGHPILLLSTAEALTPKFLRGTGRYTLGAALAPGFYPDDADARIAPYVSRYRAAFGEDPTYLDAYAYDAALAIRGAVEGGAEDRESVTAALAAGPDRAVKGVTGDVWFDKSRSRGDRGVLYTVVGDGTGGFVIRALRKP